MIRRCWILAGMALAGCGPVDTEPEAPIAEAECCADPDEPNIPQCPEDPFPPPCTKSNNDGNGVGPEPLPW